MPDAAAIILLPNAGLGGLTSWARGVRELAGAEIVSEPDACADLDAAVAACRAAAEPILATGKRLVLLPQLSGWCYAAACVVAHSIETGRPGRVAVAGWMHTDIRYDVELLRRFAQALAAVGAVSEASGAAVETFCDPVVVRTGVSMPETVRTPRAGPLRLVYTGRIERNHKRVLALAEAVRTLRQRGVECELTVIGDGPDAVAFDRAIAGLGERLAPTSELGERLAASDLYLLPSRSEGLGLGRVEAALCGCAPVVCRGSGGALEGVADGVSGLIAGAGPDDDETATGAAIAERVARFVGQHGLGGVARLGAAARETAEALFDPGRYAERLVAFLDGAVATGANRAAWAEIAERPGSFAAFTVPMDAAIRVREAIGRLGCGSVLLYGAGAHTEAVWPVIEASGVRVAAIIDDDPARHGGSFRGVPIVSIQEAADFSVRDVLISSWLHEGALWRRRAPLEAAGLRVHRLYTAASSGSSRASSA